MVPDWLVDLHREGSANNGATLSSFAVFNGQFDVLLAEHFLDKKANILLAYITKLLNPY